MCYVQAFPPLFNTQELGLHRTNSFVAELKLLKTRWVDFTIIPVKPSLRDPVSPHTPPVGLISNVSEVADIL